jgi:hypothetical protein
MRRIRGTLATTDRIPAYGGFRLSVEELETMLEELTAGAVETRLSHDSRRPLHVENVEAGIERRPDGEYALWVQLDADEDRWAEYEAERNAQGRPGGLSFTLTGTFENLPGRGEPTSVSVMVAADAAHFSDQGGACGAAGPASAPGSAFPRPARRTPGRTGYGPRIEWLGCHTNRHSAQPVGGSHADPGHQEAKVSASRSTICDAFAVSLAGVIGG